MLKMNKNKSKFWPVALKATGPLSRSAIIEPSKEKEAAEDEEKYLA